LIAIGTGPAQGKPLIKLEGFTPDRYRPRNSMVIFGAGWR
jgi:hypothetical protein